MHRNTWMKKIVILLNNVFNFYNCVHLYDKSSCNNLITENSEKGGKTISFMPHNILNKMKICFYK